MSTIESSLYFNNISNTLSNGSVDKNFLKSYSALQANFTNLNFFENSRLWLFKKYFFNNNQNQNIIVDGPKLSLAVTNDQNKNLAFSDSTFSTEIYLNKLSLLTYNTLTPSLNNYVNSSNVILSSTGLNNKTSNSVSLNTNSLDILNSLNNNFIYTLTSNTQQLNNSTNYFNQFSVSSLNTQTYVDLSRPISFKI
jgi:hypothetical protein